MITVLRALQRILLGLTLALLIETRWSMPFWVFLQLWYLLIGLTFMAPWLSRRAVTAGRARVDAAVREQADRIAGKVRQQVPRRTGGIVSLPTGHPVAFAPPEAVVSHYRRPLPADRGLVEVTAIGWIGAQYVEGLRMCGHRGALPVETMLGELVAWLCPGCDQQLPADWKNP